jgi:hypothetical protein
MFVGVIVMKKLSKLLCIIISLCVAVCLFAPAFSDEEQVSTSRLNTLTTTNDMTRYSVFTTDGDTIEAHGFYEGDVVTKLEMTGSPFTSNSMSFRPNPDGSYSATFTGVPVSTPSYITLTLEEGGIMYYRVDYDNGWHFSDVGLGVSQISMIENYSTIPLAATVQYLIGESGTREDVEAVLDEISELVTEIISGIDSDYDKAKAISCWVSENIYYDKTARDTDVNLETVSLKNVLSTRKTICAGYANLTSAMLETAGLKAVTVIGSALAITDDEYDIPITVNRHHEWTAFWLEEDERWVLLDAGWDSWNFFEEGRLVLREAPRRYFDITSLAFAQNHRAVKAEYRDYLSAVDFDFTNFGISSSTDEADEGDGNTSQNNTDTSDDDKNNQDEEEPYVQHNRILPYLIPVFLTIIIAIIGATIHLMVYGNVKGSGSSNYDE